MSTTVRRTLATGLVALTPVGLIAYSQWADLTAWMGDYGTDLRNCLIAGFAIFVMVMSLLGVVFLVLEIWDSTHVILPLVGALSLIGLFIGMGVAARNTVPEGWEFGSMGFGFLLTFLVCKMVDETDMEEEETAGKPATSKADATEEPWRDQVAVSLCNWILTHLATRHYRTMLKGTIRLGLATALTPPSDSEPIPADQWRKVSHHMKHMYATHITYHGKRKEASSIDD